MAKKRKARDEPAVVEDTSPHNGQSSSMDQEHTEEPNLTSDPDELRMDAEEDATMNLDPETGSVSSHTADEQTWSPEDCRQLVQRITILLRRNDDRPYALRVKHVKWEKVKFAQYSAVDCLLQWQSLAAHVRTYRLMAEVIADVKVWLARHPSDDIEEPDSKRPKTKLASLPEFPKHPKNPFIIHRGRVSAQLHKDIPGVSLEEINKRAAASFQTLDRPTKRVIAKEAAEDSERYQREKQDLAEKYSEITSLGKSGTVARGSNDPPLRPTTSYSIYCRERRNPPQGQKNAIMPQLLRAEWNTMSDLDKIPFVEKAIAEWEQYKQDFAAFRQRHPKHPALMGKCAVSPTEKLMVQRASANPAIVTDELPRPSPPLIARSGYQLFLHEYREAQKEKGSLLASNRTGLPQSSGAWKALTENKRSKYADRIRKIWDEYYRDVEVYLSNIPDLELRAEQRASFNLKKTSSAGTEQSSTATRKKKRPETVPAEATEAADPAVAKSTRYDAARKHYVTEKEFQYQMSVPGLTPEEVRCHLAEEFDLLAKKEKKSYQEKAASLANIF